MNITQLLAFSVKSKASDLHLSAGLVPNNNILVSGDAWMSAGDSSATVAATSAAC